jgi:hypothetical protein
MGASQESHVHLEIAHILFLDVVGYSRLLVNEQREVLQQLNEVVRGSPQFRKSSVAGKLIRIATGDGMALVFLSRRTSALCDGNCQSTEERSAHSTADGRA